MNFQPILLKNRLKFSAYKNLQQCKINVQKKMCARIKTLGFTEWNIRISIHPSSQDQTHLKCKLLCLRAPSRMNTYQPTKVRQCGMRKRSNALLYKFGYAKQVSVYTTTTNLTCTWQSKPGVSVKLNILLITMFLRHFALVHHKMYILRPICALKCFVIYEYIYISIVF